MPHTKLIPVTAAILSILIAIFIMAAKPEPPPELPATFLLTLFDGDIVDGELKTLGPIDIEEFSQFSLLGTSNRAFFIEFIFTTASGDMRTGGRCRFSTLQAQGIVSWGIGVNECRYNANGGVATYNDGVFRIAGPFLKIRIQNTSGTDATVTLKAFLRR